MRNEVKSFYISPLLKNQSPVQAKVSDHNILIHGQVLFFNMMMRCLWNATKHRYNNGFGQIESISQYRSRISLIVRLLAEALYYNPHVSMIGLAEAPIQPEDIGLFISEAKDQPTLKRFFATADSSRFSSMGIATFFNAEKYKAKQLSIAGLLTTTSLYDRVQQFSLSDSNTGKFLFNATNLHLPYDLAKSKDPSKLIQFSQGLFKSNPTAVSVVMGDFNIYPAKIAQNIKKVYYYIQLDNNILVKADHNGNVVGSHTDTVDAIMQAGDIAEKARGYNSRSAMISPLCHFGFFRRLVCREEAKVEGKVARACL